MAEPKKWIKFWVKNLYDPNIAKLPDWLWRRKFEFDLMAGERNEDGALPPVEDMLWTLRLDEAKLSQALQMLAEVGEVFEAPVGSGQWFMTNFANEQADTTAAKRMREYRERRREAGMPSGYTYSHSEIMKRDGYQCVYCGSKENLCVDHAYPIVLGGTDDYDNLVTACKKCNSSKAGRTPEQAEFTFKNKEAEKRYKSYVTVTCYRNKLPDDSSSSSLSSSESFSESSSDSLELHLDSWDWQPKTPKQAVDHPALQIFQQVSGGLPGERDYNKVIQWILLIARKYKLSPDKLPDYLAPYCQAWTSQIGQNGRNYDPLNVNWLLQAYNQTPLDARPKGQNGSKAKPMSAIDKIEQEIREKGSAWKPL